MIAVTSYLGSILAKLPWVWRWYKKSKTCRAGLYSYNIWSKVREKDKAYTQNGYSSVKLLTIPEMYDTFATASACKWNVSPIDSNVLIDFPESLSAQELLHFNKILTYIQACNHEQNIDKKVQLLRFINSMLPNEIQIRIPSLITDDYVESALYNLEMACKNLTKLKKLFSLCIMNMFKTTKTGRNVGETPTDILLAQLTYSCHLKFYLYSFFQGVQQYVEIRR